MPIDSNARPAYMFKDGTWYTVAGKVATGANYVWGGTHTFNTSLTAEGTVEVRTKFNSFDTAAARNAAMNAPQEGLISYIENDLLGNPANRFEYWDGTEWTPIVPLDIVLEDKVQTLTNKTLDTPEIIGGIENAEYIQFDTTNAQAIAVGKMMWDSTAGTLVVGIGDGSVAINVGGDLIQSVVNEESLTTIPRGNVVYQNGSATASDLLTVRRAMANSESTARRILGVTTQNINSSATGTVMRRGLLTNIDTSAYPQGATIYLSSSTNGGLTSVRPIAPNIPVKIGYCVESAVNGVIYVDIEEGFKIDELIGVNTSGLANGNILQYKGQFWVNTSSPTGLVIDGSTNTIQNISQTSIVGLTSGLNLKLDKSLLNGGQTNYILTKKSGSDLDFEWRENQGATGNELPVGGTTGQVLAKASETDYDVTWTDQTGGGGGGTVIVNPDVLYNQLFV